MKDIDFLPLIYREATQKRKNARLRIAVVVLFVAVIGAAAVYQQWLRREALRELAALDAPYMQALAQKAHLANLKSRVDQAEKTAELWAYLQHPWPRSQIVAKLCEPLPATIFLDQIEIGREPLPQPIVAETAVGNPSPTAEPAKLTPADRDLTKMRQEYDTKQVTIILSGQTDNPPDLHRYLEQIGKAAMFKKVDLQSVEQMTGDAQGRTRFSAKAIVVPGYLQPGGPAMVETAEVAR